MDQHSAPLTLFTDECADLVAVPSSQVASPPVAP